MSTSHPAATTSNLPPNAPALAPRSPRCTIRKTCAYGPDDLSKPVDCSAQVGFGKGPQAGTAVLCQMQGAPAGLGRASSLGGKSADHSFGRYRRLSPIQEPSRGLQEIAALEAPFHHVAGQCVVEGIIHEPG